MIALAVCAVGAGAFVWKRKVPTPDLDCATAFRTAPDGVAVVVCQREYERTRRPVTGAYFANALRRSGNVVAARALANDLLSTDARGDALQILGRIALAQNRTDEAVKLLQESRQIHRERGKRADLATDDQVIAEIHTGRKQYAEALQMLEECISEARAVADDRTEALCHLTAGRALMNAGYFEAAHEELDRAAQLLSEDRDLAVAWYWRGNLEQEAVRGLERRSHNEQAVAAFERAFELAKRGQRTSLLPNIHMNLAYSLAELGRTEEADRHLAEAGVLDRDGKYVNQRAQLAARIAYRRGNLALALSLNEQVYPSTDDADEQIEISVMQATIALATNDLTAAALWAGRGVDAAEQIRAKQPLGELRPWVLASRREPFELQFIAFARAGRVDDAISVFDRWQGRSLLDEMARPSPEPLPGLSSMATRIQDLWRWLPAVSKAPLLTSDQRPITRTLGMIDLVALAVAEGDVWRITASRGKFRLDDLGSLAELRDRLDRFTTVPTDPALAGELGALILPDDVVRKTDDPLYVVLDAPFAALPFVALRRNDKPLIVTRPVIRAPRLPVASSCEPRAGIVSALVIADAIGDLPNARRESSRVASLFRTTPLVGSDATSTALFATKSDLLHLAVHADIDAGGGILKLHDRKVSAPEISSNKLGPSLVVLSACSTARSGDPELAGSLSTAFLAGGSRQVIATLRPVSDLGAFDLTSRFYDSRGAYDPVRVLAKIQAELSQSDNKDWPKFAVFSNEVCVPGFRGQATSALPTIR